MKINFDKIEKQLINIIGNNYSWIAIPSSDYIQENKTLEEVGYKLVWFCIYKEYGYIEFCYNENGMTFNKETDWTLEININGKIKGQGKIKQKKNIEYALKWIIKALNDNNYTEMFSYEQE